MKVVVSALHSGQFKNFASVVEALAGRGHRVQLLVDEPEALGGEGLVAELVARFPAVSWGWAPSYGEEAWFPVARKLRQGVDYLRYLEPAFGAYPKLRMRLAERVPRGLLGLMRVPLVNTGWGRRALRRGAEAVAAALPRHAGMDAWLRRERPDVVLLTAVTNPRAPQVDHLRSARALGIPTGVCVYSWDHLSSKALIRVEPDRVLVWNATQQREAVELHGLAADRVTVTGAQCYDEWFGRGPSRDRAAFCAGVGLPADRALVVYVCSALTPDPGEVDVVRRWVGAVRGSADERVREAGILIRPHPERRGEWAAVDVSGWGPAVVTGENPLTAATKADYFDTLYHADAVVGLVTSAFLEAAVVGRPVLALTLPELAVHQMGMQHFRYLVEVEAGLVATAETVEAHVAQLATVLVDATAQLARQARFLRAFVRPAGLDVAATPAFVAAVEALGAERPAAYDEVAAQPAWRRRLAAWLVEASQTTLGAALLEEPRRRLEVQARDRGVRAHRREKRRLRRARRWRNAGLLLRSVEYRRATVNRLLGRGQG